MKLIVGLGNPGKEYDRTRHNAGFMAIDHIIERFKIEDLRFDKRSNAETGKGEIDGKRAVLAKPQTFMNNSGESVRKLVDFYKLSPADVIVLHDDKDIPIGKTRVQKERGAAGHNGVLSIIEHLGTNDFWRIRIGVAPVEKKIADTADFVLGRFTAEEQKTLKTVFEHVACEVEKLLND